MTPDESEISEISVPGTSVRLHYKIVRPSFAARSRLLIVHGYGEHSGRYGEFMHWLAGHGVVCEAIDLRGHGLSTGRRVHVRRWDEYLDDLKAFLDVHLRAAAPAAPPLFVLGHSHGGLIVAAAGESGMLSQAGVAGCIFSSPYLKTLMPIPRAKRWFGLVANHVAPWLHVPTGMQGQWLTSDPEKAAEDRIDRLKHHLATPRWFVTMSAMQNRVMSDAAKFALPLLCLAGDADIIADPQTTAEFFRRAESRDKSLYVYPGFVHEVLREQGRAKVFEHVLGWMRARS
jgi:alpha-beta hydrolase superfamily lysophospholipase